MALYGNMAIRTAFFDVGIINIEGVSFATATFGRASHCSRSDAFILWFEPAEKVSGFVVDSKVFGLHLREHFVALAEAATTGFVRIGALHVVTYYVVLVARVVRVAFVTVIF